MTPQAIRKLRDYLQLTQEVFARILGVSFATVNRWENGRAVPTGDYARVLQTLQQLTANDALDSAIDWKRVGALSAMAAVAGFSPILTLGAALSPVLIARLPSWSDVPLGRTSLESLDPGPREKATTSGKRLSQTSSSFVPSKAQVKTEKRHPRAVRSKRANTQRTGLPHV
jgi:transcriptional regulator with XRE-family HTH domain